MYFTNLIFKPFVISLNKTSWSRKLETKWIFLHLNIAFQRGLGSLYNIWNFPQTLSILRVYLLSTGVAEKISMLGRTKMGAWQGRNGKILHFASFSAFFSGFCHFWSVSAKFACFSSTFACFSAIYLPFLPIGRTVPKSTLVLLGKVLLYSSARMLWLYFWAPRQPRPVVAAAADRQRWRKSVLISISATYVSDKQEKAEVQPKLKLWCNYPSNPVGCEQLGIAAWQERIEELADRKKCWQEMVDFWLASTYKWPSYAYRVDQKKVCSQKNPWPIK